MAKENEQGGHMPNTLLDMGFIPTEPITLAGSGTISSQIVLPVPGHAGSDSGSVYFKSTGSSSTIDDILGSKRTIANMRRAQSTRTHSPVYSRNEDNKDYFSVLCHMPGEQEMYLTTFPNHRPVPLKLSYEDMVAIVMGSYNLSQEIAGSGEENGLLQITRINLHHPQDLHSENLPLMPGQIALSDEEAMVLRRIKENGRNSSINTYQKDERGSDIYKIVDLHQRPMDVYLGMIRASNLLAVETGGIMIYAPQTPAVRDQVDVYASREYHTLLDYPKDELEIAARSMLGIIDVLAMRLGHSNISIVLHQDRFDSKDGLMRVHWHIIPQRINSMDRIPEPEKTASAIRSHYEPSNAGSTRHYKMVS